MSTHWGEMPNLSDMDSGIVALEREQLTKLRPMEVEGPPLHQPTSEEISPNSVQILCERILASSSNRFYIVHYVLDRVAARWRLTSKGIAVAENEPQPHPAEAFVVDSLTLHTIELIQYAKKVRSMIQNVHQQMENWKSEGDNKGEMPIFPEASPVPEFHGLAVNHQTLKPLSYMTKDLDSPFARGFGPPPPEVDSRNCRKLLRRSVATVCAHAGFDTCGEQILETMTDVTHEYFLQMTKLLRRAVDNEAITGGTGFPDVMEQVFHEMGIGSPRVLHEFYQNRIINYHKNMVKNCNKLLEEYNHVRVPIINPSEDVKPVIKTEEKVSDIQFPALEEDEGGDSEHVIHLDSLGLDINIVNESGGDENGAKAWSQTIKTEQDKGSGLDSYEHSDSPAVNTPMMGGSEAGDSIHDPGSVSTSDIMSPPSIGIRNPKPPPKKKLKS